MPRHAQQSRGSGRRMPLDLGAWVTALLRSPTTCSGEGERLVRHRTRLRRPVLRRSSPGRRRASAAARSAPIGAARRPPVRERSAALHTAGARGAAGRGGRGRGNEGARKGYGAWSAPPVMRGLRNRAHHRAGIRAGPPRAVDDPAPVDNPATRKGEAGRSGGGATAGRCPGPSRCGPRCTGSCGRRWPEGRRPRRTGPRAAGPRSRRTPGRLPRGRRRRRCRYPRPGR